MTFIAWPEIVGFHNIRKFIRVDPGEWWQKKELLSGSSVVTYRAKVKLHGTNAAVQVHTDGSVVVQSRENIISVEKDNAGFARFIAATCMVVPKAGPQKCWENAKGHILYGEWCGPGIQKGVAIAAIPKKVFAIFAARPLDGSDKLIVEPDELSALLTDELRAYGVHVLPWYTRPAMHGTDTRVANILTIDWRQTDEELSKTIAPVNDWVMEIEANDPWVKETFGVDGTGEGLVFYPYSEAHRGFESFTNLCFKAKGEKHKNIATAKPVQVNAEAAASIEAFVNLVLTEARLEQGAKAVGGTHIKYQNSMVQGGPEVTTFSDTLTGKFIAWVSADVEKETKDELAASNLTFKEVQKAISTKARTWYLAKVKQ